MKKTKPLIDTDSQQRDVAADFDKKWEEGGISGWDDGESKPQANGADTSIWCGACKENLGNSFFLTLNKLSQVKNIIQSKPSMMHTLPQKSTSKLSPSRLHLANLGPTLMVRREPNRHQQIFQRRPLANRVFAMQRTSHTWLQTS
jgi:hypothetical protein